MCSDIYPKDFDNGNLNNVITIVRKQISPLCVSRYSINAFDSFVNLKNSIPKHYTVVNDPPKVVQLEHCLSNSLFFAGPRICTMSRIRKTGKFYTMIYYK